MSKRGRVNVRPEVFDRKWHEQSPVTIWKHGTTYEVVPKGYKRTPREMRTWKRSTDKRAKALKQLYSEFTVHSEPFVEYLFIGNRGALRETRRLIPVNSRVVDDKNEDNWIKGWIDIPTGKFIAIEGKTWRGELKGELDYQFASVDRIKFAIKFKTLAGFEDWYNTLSAKKKAELNGIMADFNWDAFWEEYVNGSPPEVAGKIDEKKEAEGWTYLADFIRDRFGDSFDRYFMARIPNGASYLGL